MLAHANMYRERQSTNALPFILFRFSIGHQPILGCARVIGIAEVFDDSVIIRAPGTKKSNKGMQISHPLDPGEKNDIQLVEEVGIAVGIGSTVSKRRNLQNPILT